MVRTPNVRSRARATRRSARAAALALLAFAPTARAGLAQTPDITDTRYRSVLTHVSPLVAGVKWQVIDLNDEVELINHSGMTVTVYGYSQALANVAYDGGPYARILGNGTVQVNENSPAYYLNKSFYADYANVPKSASGAAPPRWVTEAKTGTYTWHDHRIHYTSPAVPLQVKDVHRTTFIFDWYIPIVVGSTRGYLAGKLYWIGEKSFSVPIGAIIALVVVAVGGAAFVIVVRRRRRTRPPREVW